MVTTPWCDREITMAEAAELGTRKVMEEHCTIGLVITTDGSVTDIPREEYIAAERRAIADMKATGKPFLVIVNSRVPGSEEAAAVQAELQREYGICSFLADCQAMDKRGIGELLKAMLFCFPMKELRVFLPRWLDALERDHPLKTVIFRELLDRAKRIENLGQSQALLSGLEELDQVQSVSVQQTDLGRGCVSCRIQLPQVLFYDILSDRAGVQIRTDGQLMSHLMSLAQIKREYDKISDALSSVKATGYGVVMPTAEELKLETPEVVRKGGAFGVRLKAGAPSIHMLRVDIDTEINPMVGDEKQSRDLIGYLTGEDPEKLWQSHIFGKSVYDLIQEGMTAKLIGLPEDVREKFRGTLTRIVNEGAAGLICLIL